MTDGTDELAVASNVPLPISPAETSSSSKSMSPEKAALTAMFASIQMPPPASPTRSPRKPATFGSSSKPLLTRGTWVPGRLLASTASPASTRSSSLRSAKTSSSPTTKLADMSLLLDPTGTHEFLINQTLGHDSFLAAGAPDVTISDSFDVSKARAKFTARKPGTKSALGVGRVVKNAAGEDTIELSSFVAASTSMMDNLLDESGQNSMLFGDSFSLTVPQRGLRKSGGSVSSSSEDDDNDVRLWTGNRITKTATAQPTTGQIISSTRTAVPRRGLLPSTGLSALPSARMPAHSRSSTVPASSRSVAVPCAEAPAAIPQPQDGLKTPMRQSRKSTFTTTRPPVSGPLRRRESLLPSLASQPPAPKTPGRLSSTCTAVDSPVVTTRTPRVLARPRASLATSATPRAAAAMPTSISSSSLSSLTSSGAVSKSIGTALRPRTSVVAGSDGTPKPAARLPRSSILTRSPSSSNTRPLSSSLARPISSTRAPDTVRATRTLVPRASMTHTRTSSLSRPASSIVHSEFGATKADDAHTTLGEIGNVPKKATALAPGASKIARPRSSLARPSSEHPAAAAAPKTSTFGYRSRPSQAPLNN